MFRPDPICIVATVLDLKRAPDTNLPYLFDSCHREVREAYRGDPAGLLRRYASRNDSLIFTGRWHQMWPNQAQRNFGMKSDPNRVKPAG